MGGNARVDCDSILAALKELYQGAPFNSVAWSENPFIKMIQKDSKKKVAKKKKKK
jgi:hypothetical protein